MVVAQTLIRVDDYDSWKAMFDAGRETVRRDAKGHRIVRAADDPNEVFIQVEFDSIEDANSARERLLESGALERVDVLNGPTVAEVAEALTY